METKAITLTIVFAALTVALNPDISRIAFPAPYAPFLIYQIWEIPIVAAFLIINWKSAVAVAGLNAVVLFAVFQGASPLGPVYNLAAILSMLLGIYIAHILFYRKPSGITWRYNTKLAVGYTALGITFRVIIMALVNYVTLQYPPPVGFSIPQPVAVDYYVPVTSIFNGTLALYTILIGYSIALIINRNLRHASTSR